MEERFSRRWFVAGSPDWYRLSVKRIVDVVMSVAGLLLLSPLFILTAIVIKFSSSGGVIFRQQRVGLNSRRFVIYKFRTMNGGTEILSLLFGMPDESQITRVGKILRKTHLDELPQLWNVVKGDMALVGPRPCSVTSFVECVSVIPEFEKVLVVRPGITGLAQLFAKYNGTADEVARRFALDIEYIKNINMWNDICILISTAPIVCRLHGR